MFSGPNGLITFIHILFSLVCVTHVGFIVYSMLYPDVPEIVVTMKKLNEIKFPILFRICAFDIDDRDKRYTKAGYMNTYDFYMGKSMFNDSVYGWNGHQKNGSTLSMVEGNKL